MKLKSALRIRKKIAVSAALVAGGLKSHVNDSIKDAAPDVLMSID
jgi:hypothetical protein